MNTFGNDIVFNVLMERKNQIFCGDHSFSQSSRNNNQGLVLTLNKNLEPLGFTFDVETIQFLYKVDRDELVDLWAWIVPILRAKTGADREYRPMYPNFPRQVMEASNFELYFNAIVHYLTGGQLVRMYQKTARIPLIDTNVKLQVISLANEDDFVQMIAGLISANTSISETDKKHLEMVAKHEGHLFTQALQFVDSIPNKEVLAYVAGLVIVHSIDFPMSGFFKTPTDILRLATALSGGDVSLATNTKFRSFPRSFRRAMLALLDACNCDLAEEMARHAKKWIRLGERLHPFEYGNVYARAYDAFNLIRNHKVTTFNGRVELAISNKDVPAALILLQERAGEFARRLDQLFRLDPVHAGSIMAHFLEVADEVSTPVLLQVMAHFKNRNFKHLRSFMPKGSIAKMTIFENNVTYINEEVLVTCREALETVLIERFAKLPALGDVYIDPNLYGILVPSSQRSASDAMKVVTRGSRLLLNPNAQAVRGFIHWHNFNENGWEDRTDVDLSAVIYDRRWNQIEQIYYMNLRGDNGIGCHSGDIVDAPRPNGAAEFIDLNIKAMKDAGAKYAVFTVNSFRRHSFSSIDCTFGWMEREHEGSGEIFEPSTVENRINLTSEATQVVPVIFDLDSMAFVWADMTLTANTRHVNNIDGNSDNITLTARAMVEMWSTKINLFDLFTLHANARGNIVDDPDDAQFVFGVNRGDVTPFDIEKIMSEYLS